MLQKIVFAWFARAGLVQIVAADAGLTPDLIHPWISWAAFVLPPRRTGGTWRYSYLQLEWRLPGLPLLLGGHR